MNIKLLNEFGLENSNPLSHVFAFKGGAPSKSQAQIDAEKAQAEELATLKKQEESRVAAMNRKKRGRASLISGSETGENQLKSKLGE